MGKTRVKAKDGVADQIERCAPQSRCCLTILLVLLGIAAPSLTVRIHAQTAPTTVTFAGMQTTIGTGLKGPEGVAVDRAGNVYIADTGNNRIVEVTPAGV